MKCIPIAHRPPKRSLAVGSNFFHYSLKRPIPPTPKHGRKAFCARKIYEKSIACRKCQARNIAKPRSHTEKYQVQSNFRTRVSHRSRPKAQTVQAVIIYILWSWNSAHVFRQARSTPSRKRVHFHQEFGIPLGPSKMTGTRNLVETKLHHRWLTGRPGLTERVR